MKDQPGRSEPADIPQPERAVARIPPGEFDTELNQVQQQGAEESRAGTAGSPGEQTQAPGAPEASLQLPRGALVGLRRSGGFHFTSRAVVVYRNGRVTVSDGAAASSRARANARRLSDEELATLYRALEQADLPHLPPTIGHQSPDAYAYEIAARLAGRIYPVVTFDGSIPAQLSPLIRQLTAYMSEQE